MRFRIADISIEVFNDSRLETVFSLPSYHPFLIDESGPPDIRIRITTASFPDISGFKKVFMCDPWTLYAKGKELAVVVPHGPDRPPACIAKADSRFSRVTMFIDRNHASSGLSPGAILHPLDFIVFFHFLAVRDGCIIHASAVTKDGKGFLFPGRSGAGKSTLIRNLADSTGVNLLGDDRIAVRRSGNAFVIHGTPWGGDAGIVSNLSGMLTRIFFPVRHPSNTVRDISRQAVLKRLLPVVSIPWYDRALTTRMLQFLEDMVSSVPAMELLFLADGNVSDLIH